MNGSADRQEYLETAISWMVNSQKDKAIEEYMAIHQGNGEATELWLHFQKVVNWIETLFPKYRREMKGLEWGRLYREFSEKSYNPKELERRVVELMTDKEVQNNKGVYEFLLSGESRREKLNLRQFDDDEKRAAYEAQKGVCPVCGGHFEYEEMEMRPRHRRRVARARSASREAVARGRATTSCRGRRAARPFPKTSRCSAAATTRSKATGEYPHEVYGGNFGGEIGL